MRPRNLSHFIVATLIMFVLQGCEKESTPTPKTLTCKVMTITEKESGDVKSTITFTYNSDDLVEQIETELSDGDVYMDVISYASSGLPDSIYRFKVGGGSLTVTLPVFDANKRIVSSVTKTLPFEEITKTESFTYNSSGQLTEFSYLLDNGNGQTHTYTYPNTTTRNYSSITVADSGGETTVENYEYQDKKNALSTLEFLYPGAPENSFSKVTIVSPAGTDVLTFTNTFNEHGYPLTITYSVYQQVFTYNCK